MSQETPLPNAKDVRELVMGLIGREVEVLTGGAMVDPTSQAGALVGVYVDNRLKLTALVILDVPLAAYVGAALGLVPARAAQDAAYEETLTDVRLDRLYQPREPLPADIAQWVLAYVRRTDLDMSVEGYGSGRFSLLVI
jgi:hypothetical protein